MIKTSQIILHTSEMLYVFLSVINELLVRRESERPSCDGRSIILKKWLRLIWKSIYHNCQWALGMLQLLIKMHALNTLLQFLTYQVTIL